MTQGSQFGEQGVPSSCPFGQLQASQNHEKNHLLRSAGSLSEKGRVTAWNLPREAVGREAVSFHQSPISLCFQGNFLKS